MSIPIFILFFFFKTLHNINCQLYLKKLKKICIYITIALIIIYNIVLLIYSCLCPHSLQLCLTLCKPMDCSLPGSSVHGILQARTLKWVSQSVSSVAQSCPTLCDPMNLSTPGLPVHHQLPEFTQTHAH